MKSKRILSIVLVLCLCLMMVPAVATVSHGAALSVGQQNIVKRAYQMTDIKWTPLKDIIGWGNGLTYRAGVTYTGLPYGQPVNTSYVPWVTSLEEFIQAVKDANSKMYTSYSSYNKRAPYYSIDCSAFVSWAWGLNSRQTTSTIKDYATQISTSSYKNAEVGDCLCLAGSHVVLITDIGYDSNGTINSIEISEATVNSATNFCCQKTRYGVSGSNSLDKIKTKYFDEGYILYRSKTRDNVTYTHSCVVPLDGDSCNSCGSSTNPSSFDFWAGEDGEIISGKHTFWWKQEGYGSCDVNLDLNGKALGTIYPDENGLFSYTLDTTEYENGTYTLGAIIRSSNGLEKYVTRTIHIDNGSFGFWSGEDGETISGTYKFWWKQTGYESCDIELDLSGKNLGTLYPDENGLFSYTIDTSKYENGSYTISATIRSANKPEKTVSRTIYIDNGEMFFDFWSGEDGETISGTYKFWWKQVGYGECDVTIDLNGDVLTTKSPDENGLFAYTFDTTKYENGTYTIGANIQGANGSEKYVTRTIHINNVTATYTVSYNANGGIDAPATQTKYHDEDLVLSGTIPIRTGYTFMGWAESEAANSATYLPGDTITENRELVLYAVWEEIAVTEIEILESPGKTVYQIGDNLDTTGLALKVTYNDGTEATVTTDYEVSGFNSTTAGTKTVTVSYGGKSTSFTVTVEEKSEVDPNTPQIVVSNATGIEGKQVQVKLSLANNPGITSMMLQIGYDSDVLELVSVTDAGKLGNAGHSDNYARNPYVLSWENDLAREDYVVDGEIVTLTFQVAEDAPVGETPVTVSYTCDNYDIFNAAGENVWFATVNGSVNVIDVLLGDVNSDGKVNAYDRAYLARYLAKWTDYPASVINMDAADVNGDGAVNAHDRVYLARHLAKWTGYETLGG